MKENKSRPQLVPKTRKFQIPKFPSDLLGRVNAYAELVEINRDEWVANVLREKTQDLEEVQKRLKQKHRDWESGKVG